MKSSWARDAFLATMGGSLGGFILTVAISRIFRGCPGIPDLALSLWLGLPWLGMLAAFVLFVAISGICRLTHRKALRPALQLLLLGIGTAGLFLLLAGILRHLAIPDRGL